MLVSLFLKPNGQLDQRLKFQHGVHLCKKSKEKKSKANNYKTLHTTE